jgi:hypothetical protein
MSRAGGLLIIKEYITHPQKNGMVKGNNTPWKVVDAKELKQKAKAKAAGFRSLILSSARRSELLPSLSPALSRHPRDKMLQIQNQLTVDTLT